MERVVVLDLLTYCRAHKLISKQQHGFMCKRSTLITMIAMISIGVLCIVLLCIDCGFIYVLWHVVALPFA